MVFMEQGRLKTLIFAAEIQSLYVGCPLSMCQHENEDICANTAAMDLLKRRTEPLTLLDSELQLWFTGQYWI